MEQCDICDNSQLDKKNGLSCLLTKAKAQCLTKCPNIIFGEKLKKEIREINIEHHLVKITEAGTFANLIVVVSVSIAIILIGYFIGSNSFDNGIFPTIPLTVIGIGLLILPLAIFPLNKYRRGISFVKKKKKQLDDILLNYNIECSFDIPKSNDLNGNKKKGNYWKIWFNAQNLLAI